MFFLSLYTNIIWRWLWKCFRRSLLLLLFKLLFTNLKNKNFFVFLFLHHIQTSLLSHNQQLKFYFDCNKIISFQLTNDAIFLHTTKNYFSKVKKFFLKTKNIYFFVLHSFHDVLDHDPKSKFGPYFL